MMNGSGMNTIYFWLLLAALLTAFRNWYVLCFILLCKLLNYYVFQYERKVPKSKFKVAIIGAGFSGIGMAIKLKKMGVDNEVFEAASEIGGTWHANRYPGCRCDVQSHFYSYSFFPNALWARKYPEQKEIQDYLKNVARACELNIHLNTKVISANFDNESKTYKLVLTGDQICEANVIVSATGALRLPNTPILKGYERFKGKQVHSSMLHPGIDYEGKRVAVIGTGASAVQIVPEICDKVSRLTVFQRTACWSPPKWDTKVPTWLMWLYYYIPGVLYVRRMSIFLIHEFYYFAIFRKDSYLASYLRKLISKHHRTVVNDPETATKLIPTFAPGCKRISMSDDYLQTFNKRNVFLVTEPISEITETGVKTKNGSGLDFDLIIYATGYSLLESYRKAYDLDNGQGVKLIDVMTNNPRAHLGITFPDIPNFFIIRGPQTGVNYTSVVWIIECQINYIAKCIRKMIENRVSKIAVREDRMNKFYETVATYMGNKVFHDGCVSWYKNEDGTGFNYALWPSNLVHYWWVTKRSSLGDFVWS